MEKQIQLNLPGSNLTTFSSTSIASIELRTEPGYPNQLVVNFKGNSTPFIFASPHAKTAHSKLLDSLEWTNMIIIELGPDDA